MITRKIPPALRCGATVSSAAQRTFASKVSSPSDQQVKSVSSSLLHDSVPNMLSGLSNSRSLSKLISLKDISHQSTKIDPAPKSKKEVKNSAKPKKKTMAELDEELRLKLEGISGEGGGAGVEYEDGKASGLKRGVKDNMFRVI